MNMPESKFGGASAHFDGASDYLIVAPGRKAGEQFLEYHFERHFGSNLPRLSNDALAELDSFLRALDGGEDALLRGALANLIDWYKRSRGIDADKCCGDPGDCGEAERGRCA